MNFTFTIFTFSLFCIVKFGKFLISPGNRLVIFRSVNQFSKSYVFVDIPSFLMNDKQSLHRFYYLLLEKFRNFFQLPNISWFRRSSSVTSWLPTLLHFLHCCSWRKKKHNLKRFVTSRLKFRILYGIFLYINTLKWK